MLNKLKYNWYRFKYRHGQHLPLRKPVDISLELASICNMKCGYCYHAVSDVPFAKDLMTKETAYKIIDQGAKLGVNSIKMNWRGESTINKHFYMVTKRAKDWAHGATYIDRLSNSNFKFNSNREDIFEGFANQTKVKVSYDSFDKDVFETQRAGGRHDITTRNIDLFYNHASRIKSETEIVIQAVRTSLNKDEDIAGLAKAKWPEATISIRDMVEGRVDKDLSDLTHKERDLSERQSCLQAHVRLIFNHEGTATVCCPDITEELKMGNIHKMSMKEIFNCHHARTLREELKNKRAFLFDPCRNCSSFETYKDFKPVWNS